LDQVTESYINELAHTSQVLELWLYDKGKKTILLGQAKVLLSDLVYGSAFGSSKKGPRVKKMLDIMPSPKLDRKRNPHSIGSMKVVFNLRRSIKDMAEHIRLGTRARDSSHMKDGAPPEIVNVKINVQKCEDMKVKYA
jgi:hypothetical protein